MKNRNSITAFTLVVVVLFVICPVLSHAEPVIETIKLQNTPPRLIMNALGLLSFDEYAFGKELTWRDDQKSVGQPPVPPVDPKVSLQNITKGIESVTAFEKDNSLVIKGEKDAIDEFKHIVHTLDVPRKMVQVKADIYKISTEMAEYLTQDGQQAPVISSGSDSMQRLMDYLKESGAAPISSPIVSTLASVPATVAIGLGETRKTEFFVLPRINGDKTTTLYMSFTIEECVKNPAKDEPPVSLQTVRTNRRVANGESVAIGGFITKDSNELVVIVTPKIIE